MIVLDTNVVSALMQQPLDREMVAWLNDQPPESIWTSSVTVYEVRYGLALLPAGRRRSDLERAFEATLREDIQQRVLDLDSTAATVAARISAELRVAGRSIEVRDALIAGIVAARRGSLATRNTKHFSDTGIPLLNPWNAPG